jgi:hypothetical protein
MVFGSHAKTCAMYSTPPCPSLAASTAAYRRRSFSDNHPKKRCLFPSISAEYPSMPSSLLLNLLRSKDTPVPAIREIILDHILRHQKRSSGGPYQGLSVFVWVGVVLLLVCLQNVASSEVGSMTRTFGALPVQLHRDSGSTSVTSWPVTLGVPFREGALHPSTKLGVVDD